MTRRNERESKEVKEKKVDKGKGKAKKSLEVEISQPSCRHLFFSRI